MSDTQALFAVPVDRFEIIGPSAGEQIEEAIKPAWRASRENPVMISLLLCTAASTDPFVALLEVTAFWWGYRGAYRLIARYQKHIVSGAIKLDGSGYLMLD